MPYYWDERSKKVWICPVCVSEKVDEDIVCEGCSGHFHFGCVGVTKQPSDDEVWFCLDCEDKIEFPPKVPVKERFKKELAKYFDPEEKITNGIYLANEVPLRLFRKDRGASKYPNMKLGLPYYIDFNSKKIWLCRVCRKSNNGSKMISCTKHSIETKFHFSCVGFEIPPPANLGWRCIECIKSEVMQKNNEKEKKVIIKNIVKTESDEQNP